MGDAEYGTFDGGPLGWRQQEEGRERHARPGRVRSRSEMEAPLLEEGRDLLRGKGSGRARRWGIRLATGAALLTGTSLLLSASQQNEVTPVSQPEESTVLSSLESLRTLKARDGGKPHVFVILMDDLGYNDIGYANDDFMGLTDTLDGLREGGISLENYYSQHLCTPARSALLSGKYPYTTGMQVEVIKPWEPWGLAPSVRVMPQIFKDQGGFATHMVGKWHLGHAYDDLLPTNRGFDSFYGFLTDQTDYKSHINGETEVLDFTDANATFSECVTNEAGVHNMELHNARILRTVEEFAAAQTAKKLPSSSPSSSSSSSSSSLFMYLAYQYPHYPLQPDSEVGTHDVAPILDAIEDRNRQKVGKMVYELDRRIQELVHVLQTQDMWEDSVLVFASDNGGCPSYGTSNYPLRGTKHYMFEGSSKVRAFIHSPLLPESSRGQKYEGLFHVTDWLPTLMEAIGIGDDVSQHNFDGVSHWQHLQPASSSPAPATAAAVARETMVYNLEILESGQLRGAVRVGRWKVILNEVCQGWADFGDRKDGAAWTLACADAGAVESCGGIDGSTATEMGSFLFDLEEDPQETTNLIADMPDVYNSLLETVQTLLEKGVSSNRVSTPSNPTARWQDTGCISPYAEFRPADS